jgi:murein DD-endopeptidase MepM/ murein hydrolase activator NlpD
MPVAQVSADLIDSEATTTTDSAIYAGSSGILSEDYPVPSNGNPFGGFRKDVTTYVVEGGDTPFDIAAKFDINTDTILWANNLRDGDIIRPGDKLLILPINGVRVKIGAKDTLESLAKKYSGKVPEIQQFNGLESDNLAVGSYLMIPDGEPATLPSQKSTKYTAPEYAKSTAPANDWLIAPTTGYDWGILHYNNAVDIANVCGTPIYAAAAGKVILSDGIGWNGGYGKNIKIQHPNGVITHYAHASQLLVDVGDEVAQGQLIALMGTTGHSTGCHLHFEVIGAKNPLVGRQNIGI